MIAKFGMPGVSDRGMTRPRCARCRRPVVWLDEVICPDCVTRTRHTDIRTDYR